MASSTSLPHVKVDFGYTLSVTVDFEADLSTLHHKKIALPVPLEGEWMLNLCREKGGDIMIGHAHGNVQEAYFGTKVIRSVSIFWLKGGQASEIALSKWGQSVFPRLDKDGKAYSSFTDTVTTTALAAAQTDSTGQFDVSTHRRYRIVCKIISSCPELETLERVGIAERVADLHLEQLPSQLRLYFPNVGKDGAELWVSSDLLSQSVPYFEDLLSADFSEATPRRSKRARKSGAQPLPAPPAAEKDFEDSDDETDAFLLEQKPLRMSDSTEASEHPFRQITITQTSFSTYHALLVYLETGYIRFAPLRSASSPSNSSAPSFRNDFLSEHFEDNPSLPFPISPKSMFRLADLLRPSEEDPLSSLCLRAFSDSLTHHGAAFELFGDASVFFDKVRKIALEYVAKNWGAISATASWKEKMAKIKAGEMPEAAGIMVELMEVREEVAMNKKST